MRKYIGSLKHVIININELSVILPNMAIAITVRRPTLSDHDPSISVMNKVGIVEVIMVANRINEVSLCVSFIIL
jgi:hypothetical protein